MVQTPRAKYTEKTFASVWMQESGILRTRKAANLAFAVALRCTTQHNTSHRTVPRASRRRRKEPDKQTKEGTGKRKGSSDDGRGNHLGGRLGSTLDSVRVPVRDLHALARLFCPLFPTSGLRRRRTGAVTASENIPTTELTIDSPRRRHFKAFQVKSTRFTGRVLLDCVNTTT